MDAPNSHLPFDILLVEDNPADVEITLEAFRRSHKGNRVFVCCDGEETLDFLFQRGPYSNEREEDVSRCYKFGANSYLTKPVQFDDCLKLVEEIQQYWLHTSKLPPKNKTVP
jgi:two-component system response regulator